MSTTMIRGLPIPEVLVKLVETRRWMQPADDALRRAAPTVCRPLNLLTSFADMERESRIRSFPAHMHVYLGNNSEPKHDLPWLDMERAVFIAVNREIGDDVAIALDYRPNMAEPRVVASEWCGDACWWRAVAKTMEEFAVAIGV